ncbi:MAG: hemagglutinin repeat-containing protein [Limnohabitans sp.]
MNKQSHRIIFNKSRGCLMAVAETTTSTGKSASGETAGPAHPGHAGAQSRTLNPLALACKLISQVVLIATASMSLVPMHLHAQAQTNAVSMATRIVADPGAARSQQATVLSTSNGVVQVNIQTPSAAGVSRNTYSQFDVGSQGVILNNSRTNVQTQQGGWVQGNPWLATGSARVILNEVNSANPSYLQGYVEVAGQRAEVVIANPAGIAVNGGGFINASGVTLTTGTPVVNNGSLERYRVTGGSVSVDGLGLDTRTADYTAVLTRAAQVNAGIWAKRLQMVTGANDIAAGTLGTDVAIESTPLTATGTAPAYAVDVSQLGGMYAGKITLIGTDAGLGVRNAGLIQASSGPLTLTQEGWLQNSGALQATGGDVQIQTRGTIAQNGIVYSDHNVQLTSGANQTHSGTTAALGHVNILAKGTNTDGSAAQIQANKSTVWAAGLQTDGQLTGQQNLNVQASGQVQTAGKALATQNLTVQGASLDLSQSSQQAATVQLQAITGDLKATGSQILATEQLQMQTPQTLVTDGARVQAPMLTLQADSLSNVAGQLIQTGSANQTIALQGSLNNTAGLIHSAAQDFNLNAQSIDNTAGQLLHAGSGTFTLGSQAQLQNLTHNNSQPALTDGARIVSTGALHITSAELTNSGSIYAAHNINTTATRLDNSGTVYTAGGQTLTTSNAITSSGTIAAAKDLTIHAGSFSGTSTNVLVAGMASDGKLTDTGALSLTTINALQTAGQALATGNASLSGASLDLSNSTTGTTTGHLSLTSTSGNVLAQSAQISTPGLLTLNAHQKLDNTSGQISAAQLNIHADQIDNTQGLIQQTGTGLQMASILGTNAVNNSAGRIVANAQDFTLSAGAALTNTDGLIGHAGTGQLTLSMSSLDNTRGQIVGNGTATASSTGDANNTSGLVAAQSLSVNAAGWNNSQGKLVATQGNLSLHTTQNTVTNTTGLIQAAQDLRLTLEGASNSLQNSQGKIIAARDASMSTGTLDNAAGLVAAGRNLTIDTHSQTLSNLGSQSATNTAPLGLIAGGQMTITSGALDNRAGLISAQTGLRITSNGEINNSTHSGKSSLIYSGGDLHLQANGLDNSTSQILAVKDATIHAGSGNLNNTTGLVRVGQTLSVQAGSVNNSNTLATQADGSPTPTGLEANNIAITTANLNNTQGAVRAAQDLSLQSDGQITNDQGELSAGRHLQISTDQATTPSLHISNAAGLIVADQSVSVRTARLSGAGTLASQGDVSLSLQGDHTLAGTLQAGQTLQLQTTGTLTNPISVQANRLSVTAGNLDNQVGGELISDQTTQLNVAGTLNNRGLIDGADTRIQANTVNNLGTGRIYGDRVAMAAGTLNNQEETISGITQAATIAGRERVDIGAQSLMNREQALIYSGGDMNIGGTLDANWRATGTAQTINNNSATIEAAQSLSIQASNIRNTNEHFATQIQQISQTPITQYQHAPGDVISARDNSTRFDPADVSITNCEALCMTTVAGTSDSFVRYNYTRTVDESVITQSAPGQILAGGGISLVATHVLNDKSQIVAGSALNVQADTLNNVQGDGTRITTDAGTVTSYWRRRRSGRDSYSTGTNAYNPAAIEQSITLNAARYQANTSYSATSAAPEASTLTPVQAQASTTGAINAATPAASLSPVAATQASAAATSVPANAQAAAGPSQTGVRTMQPGTQLPNTSLYKKHPEAGAKYLVETDPQFANYKTWLGSDYMLSALQIDPATAQKRLGDGFYEQKLIREQVLALTGNRYLGDYQSDEQQYMALMNSGLTYAKQLNLRPGIALSADQVAQLTSDMVWLVSQDVTLADGSKQSVLVPQVYVRVRPGDLDGSGALLAGADVNLNLTGDLSNSGTIAGRNALKVSADNIRNLGGQMSADTLALQAKQDIDNIGGTLQAQSAAVLLAGRDINLTTTTSSSSVIASEARQSSNSFAQTGIDRVAGLYVKGSAGVLLASAGRDLSLTAAAVGNAGTGPTVLAAGNNLNLSTVTTSNSQDINWSSVNHLRQSQSQDVGSQISAAGNLTLSAGNDLNAKAAAVNAGQALNVSAGNNVNITAGQASQSLDTANTVTSKGTLSSRTLSTRETSQSTTAVASNFEGNSVAITAGQDLNVNGSNVLADQNVNLSAGGNVNITAAQNTESQSSFRQETKSGLMGSGGIGFTVGSRMQSVDGQGQSTTAAGSTVGSTGGNVSINAGKTYTQTGSDVLTPGLNSPSGSGDIAITAQKVDINEARETGSQSTEQKFKQSGLTVAITSPVLSAVQMASSQINAAGNTNSGRMQALAGANAAFNLKQGADAIAAGQGDANGMVKNADGKMVQGNAADKAGGIGISASIGASSSQSKQQSSADSAKGSNLNAGGNVTIQATGAGANSDITVRGSSITAAGTTALKADDQVNIVAAQNTTQESSQSSNKSGSVGVAIQLGAGGGGMGFTASASAGKGQGAGNSTTYTNSQVAGNTVNIESGGDTNLKGAVVKGDQVTANVGGNLNIESLQDSSQYKEKSQQVGGSVMVGAGFSGSVNVGQTKVNSDYLSVGEQSAIRAGDGGFNVNVNGKTNLTGGQITSTQAAIDNNKNSYEAKQGTTTTDLQNSANYSAQSVSVGMGTGALPGKSASAGMSGVGFGRDSGSAQSTTTAGISGVAGNTQARTGDKSTSIAPIFDKDKVQKEVSAQVAITSEFGKQASKAVGDYAQTKFKEAEKNNDQAGIDAWKEGGTSRVAMHAVVGGLTGGAAGAVGAGAASAAAPQLDELQSQLQQGLKKAGLGDDSSKLIASLASGATAAGIGAAASGGSVAGGATAFNADMNNRQLSLPERQKAKDLANNSGGKYTQQQIEDEMRRGSNTAKGETAASNMIINPNADKALGNDPTDPVASTNFDKGAVFNNVGGSVVQVDRDGTPLGSKPGDTGLQAYIQSNTGGADSPYKWVTPQAEAVDPNASVKMKVDPNWNYMGANSAGTPSGVTTDNRTQEQVDKSLNDTTKALILVPYAAGAAVASPAAAAIGAGVNLGAQIVKGEGISPTEVMTSTIMGPLGTAVSEATAVKTIVEAGGPAAIATKAGIGTGTNVTSDSGAKIIKGEEVTSGSVLKAGVSGAVGALPKSPVMQNAITEGVNAFIDLVTKTASEK